MFDIHPPIYPMEINWMPAIGVGDLSRPVTRLYSSFPANLARSRSCVEARMGNVNVIGGSHEVEVRHHEPR